MTGQADTTSRPRPARRDPGARIAAIGAELARIRAREERRLIQAADRAGFFDLRFTHARTVAMLRRAVEEAPDPKRSALARLRRDLGRIRTRVARAARTNDARRKALLGGFLVARCRHKPELHAGIAPDIRRFLESHAIAEVAARNVELLEGFLADPHATDPKDIPIGEARLRRSHRLILLGAHVMARHDGDATIRRLLAEELPGFVNARANPKRRRDLLAAFLT